MADDLSAKLVVMDTGPLITLAAADSLDYLLYPGVPVYVPDAVLYEATRRGGSGISANDPPWKQSTTPSILGLTNVRS